VYSIENNDKFVVLDNFMELLSGGLPYVWMCTTLWPCVVGKKAWGKRCLREPLIDIVTCSDETFVLLVLDNNSVHWLAEAKWMVNNQDKAVDKCEPKLLPESKYTNNGRSKKNGRSSSTQCILLWPRIDYAVPILKQK
jgi:hypothetical protein